MSLPPPDFSGETDCEDQGFTLISDGCFNWKCLDWIGRGNNAKPVRPQFVKEKRCGTWWWTCPKCRGSYGEAPAPRRLSSTRSIK